MLAHQPAWRQDSGLLSLAACWCVWASVLREGSSPLGMSLLLQGLSLSHTVGCWERRAGWEKPPEQSLVERWVQTTSYGLVHPTREGAPLSISAPSIAHPVCALSCIFPTLAPSVQPVPKAPSCFCQTLSPCCIFFNTCHIKEA